MLDIPQCIVNEENKTRLENNNAVHLNQYKSSNMYQKCLINLCLVIQCELLSPTLFSCVFQTLASFSCKDAILDFSYF